MDGFTVQIIGDGFNGTVGSTSDAGFQRWIKNRLPVGNHSSLGMVLNYDPIYNKVTMFSDFVKPSFNGV